MRRSDAPPRVSRRASSSRGHHGGICYSLYEAEGKSGDLFSFSLTVSRRKAGWISKSKEGAAGVCGGGPRRGVVRREDGGVGADGGAAESFSGVQVDADVDSVEMPM